jgi:uncharacterized protein YceK
MTWWYVALMVWVVLSGCLAVLAGAAARAVQRAERVGRCPSVVPERWSLTLTR